MGTLNPKTGPLIVNFAPTGMVPRRNEHPEVPLQPEEIASQVEEAVRFGITSVHLHARDARDEPTLDPAVYARTIRFIREFAPELVICVSLSGRGGASVEDRQAPLDLEGAVKPDMGSLTTSSLNFTREASINAPATIAALAERMRERGIFPELEIFDLGMANAASYLARKGVLEAPYCANLLLGNLSGAQCDPLAAGLLQRGLPDGTTVLLGGIGEAQMPAHLLGIGFADGVRVGLEDNLYLDAGRTRRATNRELVERVIELAGRAGREPMTSAALRSRLRLASGHGQYGRLPEAGGPV